MSEQPPEGDNVTSDYEAAWNAQADQWNQWCDLGDDEKADWIAGKIEGSPSFRAKPPAVHGEGETPLPWKVSTTGCKKHGNEASVIEAANGRLVVYGQIEKDDAEMVVRCVNESADKDALIRGLPHTADGKPILLGDTVWFENNDTGYFGDEEFLCGVVDCLYSPVMFPDVYKGTVGVQANMDGDSWDGGNLDCWSTRRAALESFAKELELDHRSQLAEDIQAHDGQRLADVQAAIRQAEQGGGL